MMENINNGNQSKYTERKTNFMMFWGVLAVLVLIVSLIAIPASLTKCSKCGTTFFGEGYYSPDALWSSSAVNITLCKSCAAESWAPFDYKSHAK